MKERLIVALDLRSYGSITELVRGIGDAVVWYKVGAMNFTAYGTRLVDHLKSDNKRVFLDLKYHDIPNTVREAVFEASVLGVDMLTVHAVGGVKMMVAANDGVREYEDRFSKKGPTVLAVTVLTSMDDKSLREDMFIHMSVEDTVLRLAENADRAGVGGLVASAKEVPFIRDRFGDRFVIVTPGIRPASSAVDDQVRVVTPLDAVRRGCNFIVVGRPIYRSDNPREVCLGIIEEMEDVC